MDNKENSFNWDNFSSVHEESQMSRSQFTPIQQQKENSFYSYQQSRCLDDISGFSDAQSFCFYSEDFSQQPNQYPRYVHLKKLLSKSNHKGMDAFFRNIDKIKQYQESQKFETPAQFYQYVHEVKINKRERQMQREVDQHREKTSNQVKNIEKKPKKINKEIQNEKRRKQKQKVNELVDGYLEMEEKMGKMAATLKEYKAKKQQIMKDLEEVKEEKKNQMDKKLKQKDLSPEKILNQMSEIKKLIPKNAKPELIGIEERIHKFSNTVFQTHSSMRKQREKPRIINYFVGPIQDDPKFEEQSSISRNSEMEVDITSPFDLVMSDHNDSTDQPSQVFQFKKVQSLRKRKSQMFVNQYLQVQGRTKFILNDEESPLVTELKIMNRSPSELQDILVFIYHPKKLIVKPQKNYHRVLASRGYFCLEVCVNRQMINENGCACQINYRVNNEKKKIKFKVILPMLSLIKPNFISEHQLQQLWAYFPQEIQLNPKPLKLNIRQIKKILPFTKLDSEFLILFTYPLAQQKMMLQLGGLSDGKYQLKLRWDHPTSTQHLQQQIINVLNYMFFEY